MSDLDIIVLHYRESEDICKPLFDSLAMQLCVDLGEVQILLIEDGGTPLSQEFIGRYPTLNIKQILRDKNGGISEARNTGILHATADYIMFCDCDDMFYSAFGLYTIFKEMEEKLGITDQIAQINFEVNDFEKTVEVKPENGDSESSTF